MADWTVWLCVKCVLSLKVEIYIVCKKCEKCFITTNTSKWTNAEI